MNVLSLFDGISCGQVALHRAGFKPSIYFASEIEKNAIKVTQSNFPNTIQLGDVQHVRDMVLTGAFGSIDLLMGGSPCQGFSRSGVGKGFMDERSKLFFDFVAIKAAIKPRYFLLENVKMKKQDCDFISLLMGVEPIEIDSALFSAQSRKRLFWTNIPIAPIVDKQIHLWSIINWRDQIPCSDTWHEWFFRNERERVRKGFIAIANNREKACTMTARQYKNWNGNVVQIDPLQYRWFSREECERLQTLPDGYTSAAPLMAAYQALGNGWTVDVIAHILRGIAAR